MRPTGDRNMDGKAIVRCGYDRCAEAYERARAEALCPELDGLIRRLADGAHVLDAGCGAGVPVARALASRCRVTGVDLSMEQLRRARRNVPGGHFVQGDLMATGFAPASFDAVVALYVVFHLPREEHAGLFSRFAQWLRPGGLLLVSLTHDAGAPHTEDDFFGVTMYWSSHSLEAYHRMLGGHGFRVLERGTLGHGYGAGGPAAPERHPLLLAQAGGA